MAKKQKKQEALSVSRLINEVLVAQLSIPFRQIVNDTTFSKYTGSKRPDILISEFEYDGTNDEQYIKNLVAYAEAKDDCKVEDKDWKDALKQGKIKAPKLGLPYFIVTNCKIFLCPKQHFLAFFTTHISGFCGGIATQVIKSYRIIKYGRKLIVQRFQVG